MSTTNEPRPWIWLGGGLAVGLMFGVGLLAGLWMSGGQNGGPQVVFPERALHAAASDSGEGFATATGLVDDDVEGFFTLDFLTGELNCSVMYRNGKVGGRFKGTILAELPQEMGKKPHYLMTTGVITYRGVAGQSQPSRSVVYILDTATGKWAAYSLLWNRNNANAGQPQLGQFVVLDGGMARATAIRPGGAGAP